MFNEITSTWAIGVEYYNYLKSRVTQFKSSQVLSLIKIFVKVLLLLVYLIDTIKFYEAVNLGMELRK